MDYKTLAIQCYKFGSLLFDVGSDIVNGLNFLNSDGNGTSTEEQLVLNNTLRYGDRVDTAWGALTITLIFIPGLVMGFVVAIGTIVEDWKDCVNWFLGL